MANTIDSLESIFARGQTEAAGVIPNQQRPRRAFISAPTHVDTGLLREILQERNIAPYALDEVLPEGRTISELLEDCLQGADLVVAVIGAGGVDQNVAFEVGYAMAQKKRILALVPPGEATPVWLSGTPYLKTSAENREAIEFGLRTILSVPKADPSATREAAQRTSPIGRLANDLLARLSAASYPPERSELALIVGEAFQAAGVSCVAIEGIGDRGAFAPEGRLAADIAVWSDDFEPWLGNPLLSLVRRISNAKEMAAAVEQMTKLLESRKLSWGLVLYVGGFSIPDSVATQYPKVFVVAIERFLEALRDTRLGTWLGQMRNARVHGRG